MALAACLLVFECIVRLRLAWYYSDMLRRLLAHCRVCSRITWISVYSRYEMVVLITVDAWEVWLLESCWQVAFTWSHV